jgi:hypothetical protein
MSLLAVELCAGVAVALGAMAIASSAPAAEYRSCQEVAKKTGKYADSRCATIKEKKGIPDGSYEKLSVAPCISVGKKKGKYADAGCTKLDEKKGEPAGKFELCSKTSKCPFSGNSGESTLEVPAFGKNNWTCKARVFVGEITGPQTAIERITYTGCEFLGLPCQSGGPNGTRSGKPGVIITNLLKSRLVGFPEKYTVINQNFEPEEIGPKEGEVWTRRLNEKQEPGEPPAEKEPYSFEFECGGIQYVRVLGSDAGAYTKSSLNHLSFTSEVNFEATHGQGLLAEALNEKGEWVPPGGAPWLEEAGTAELRTGEIEVRN